MKKSAAGLFLGIAILLLTLVTAGPAQAWRYHCYHYYGPGPGYTAGLAGGALALGVLGGLLIGKAINGKSQAERQMLDSAAHQTSYDGYLSAVQVFNANSRQPVMLMPQNQWEQWRRLYALPIQP